MTDHSDDQYNYDRHMHDRHGLDRLTFFSDAVFAIAITLLVIEVRLPDQAVVDQAGLATVLLRLIPNYIGFVVSFAVIGRFWLGHYRAFGSLVRTDNTLVARNLYFLGAIAFMPFPTAVVSNYIDNRYGAGLYAGWLIVVGLLNGNVVRYAMRGPLLDPATPEAIRRVARRASWSPVVIGVLALAVSLIRPYYALGPLLLSPLVVWLSTWQPRRKKLTAETPLPPA